MQLMTRDRRFRFVGRADGHWPKDRGRVCRTYLPPRRPALRRNVDLAALFAHQAKATRTNDKQ